MVGQFAGIVVNDVAGGGDLGSYDFLYFKICSGTMQSRGDKDSDGFRRNAGAMQSREYMGKDELVWSRQGDVTN